MLRQKALATLRAAECLISTASAKVVTYEFQGCTGPFGLVGINGKLVATGGARNQEVKLPLKAGDNRLLLKLYNVTGGKGYSFSLTKNSRKGRGKDNSPEAVLWKLVERDFQDAKARRPSPGDRGPNDKPCK